MQPYGTPEPIVKDQSKIPATKLADTYLYDIPTKAGDEITLVGGTTGIVVVPNAVHNIPGDKFVYNLNGQRVDDSYHGIVVEKGRKYVK